MVETKECLLRVEVLSVVTLSFDKSIHIYLDYQQNLACFASHINYDIDIDVFRTQGCY